MIRNGQIEEKIVLQCGSFDGGGLFAGLRLNHTRGEVVMTDAIEVTSDGAFSDRMVSIDAGSQGNVLGTLWSKKYNVYATGCTDAKRGPH